MIGCKHFLFWFFFLASNYLIAQEISFELDDNLSRFYSEVRKENANKALELSRKIDSILSIDGDLDNESSAIYNNAKGLIYYLNNLDPKPYLIIADSLNNLLPNPNLSVMVYSSYLLGNYYYRMKMDFRAKEFYSKIIDIEGLPEQFYGYKLVALQDKFNIERSEIYENKTDSAAVKGTATKLVGFSKLLNDTLTISYGKALAFLDQENEAENVYLSINSIPETDLNYNDYNKFQALNWLSSYYYQSINFNVEDTLNAKKLITVSEQLLSVVQGTDYIEPHNLYAAYGDLVVAGIITKNKYVIDKYEKRIIDLLKQKDYPKNTSLNLYRFYYTLHRLKMFYELDKNYKKAKFYALNNVELTKYLYGEISVEHEQELLSFERLIQLREFNYDGAFAVSEQRGEIIEKLYGDNSIEYVNLLNQQYGIKLNQLDYKRCLTLSTRALNILSKLNCENLQLCEDVKLRYLQDLNRNGFYEKTLKAIDSLNFKDDIIFKMNISSVKRNAYAELNNFIGLNTEFEDILTMASGEIQQLKDANAEEIYFTFLHDYQMYLQSLGRLNKAISISENNLIFLNGFKNDLLRSDFLINYLGILAQNGDCEKALNFLENNEVLRFRDIDKPDTIEFWKYKFNYVLGNIYGCNNDIIKAIESYRKAVLYDKVDNSIVYNELARLYKLKGDDIESEKYFQKFLTTVYLKDKLDINDLYTIVITLIQHEEYDKAIEYLIPLSEKTINQICLKAFFSDNDNSSDKEFHEYLIKTILLLYQGKPSSIRLFSNAIVISNLYKRRLEYYSVINKGIQKLKVDGDEDAIRLQNMENSYNITPTKLLEEEISQLKSKLIGSGKMDFDWLCKINFNEIYKSIGKNELAINLLSYRNDVTQKDYYAGNFNLYELNLNSSDIPLQESFKIFEDINSSFWDYVKIEILKDARVNGEQINTFYIIPSGKSNLINFSAFSIPFEEKLGREINVHVINSLADIPKIKNENRKDIDNIILIGDIDFDKVSGNQKKQEKAITRGLQLTTSIEYSGIPLWGYLPGTKQEIEGIEKVAKRNHISTLLLRQNDVTESNLNKIILDPNKNTVVHIATHGFFFPDNLNADTDNLFASHKNPLLRSGLILSGANENWNNKTLVDSNNDGILTAEEISFMDLSGVELVVLSACDTGLGDVSNLEGINGLQRAFKLAGANKLIMSLWKVPDEETAEFFDQFYYFLLKEKLSINKSFRETQKIMKQKYDPFYWAAFVLLE